MPRPMSAQSEQDDGADVLLQEEHERVSNQLRVLQIERQKQTNDVNAKLGKYQSEIDMLAKENNELKTELFLTNSDQNRKKDLKSIEELKRQLTKQDEIHDQIEDTKRYNQRLDAEARKYEKMIREKQNERCIQCRAEKEAGELKEQLENKVLGMEQNLDTKKSKFSATLAENEQLKGEIEKLRNERHIFIGLQKKLTEQHAQVNRMKAKVTLHATQAYDQREDAINRTITLKEKNAKDQAAYEAEMRELQRIIDHNACLHEFMAIKSNERSEWKKEAEERRRKHGSTGEIAREQQRLKIEEFKAAYTRITDITEKDQVDAIIRIYRRKEDENFTTFNYVTELNNQVRINADKNACEEFDLQLAQIHKVLDEVKSQVKTLAVKLGCDLRRIVQVMGGDGEEITERNLMMYVSVLEHRVDELLSIKSYSISKGWAASDQQDDMKSGMTLGLIEVPSVQRERDVSLPSLNDEDETSLEMGQSAIRPFTQTELINRVTRELQRQTQISNLLEPPTNLSTSRVGSESRRSRVK